MWLRNDACWLGDRRLNVSCCLLLFAVLSLGPVCAMTALWSLFPVAVTTLMEVKLGSLTYTYTCKTQRCWLTVGVSMRVWTCILSVYRCSFWLCECAEQRWMPNLCTAVTVDFAAVELKRPYNICCTSRVVIWAFRQCTEDRRRYVQLIRLVPLP